MNLPEQVKFLPPLESLESSNIDSIGKRILSSERAYLYVKFTSSRIYVYEMPKDTLEMHYSLIKGRNISAGVYFNNNIKDNGYQWWELTGIAIDKPTDWSAIFSADTTIGRRCGLVGDDGEFDYL